MTPGLTLSLVNLFFAESPDGIVVIDSQNGMLIHTNKKMQSIFGYTEQELASMHYTRLHPPGSEKRLLPETDSVSRPLHMMTFSVPCVRKDGALFHTDISSSFCKADGKEYLIGTFRPSEERLKLEDKLERAEKLSDSILRNIPDGITIVSPEGTVLYANQRALELFGYESEADVKGKPVSGFIAPEDRERGMANIQKLLTLNLSLPEEYTGVKTDGSRFPVQINGSILYDKNANPDKIVLVSRDQTKLSHLQNAFEKRVKEMECLYGLSDDWTQTDIPHEDWQSNTLERLSKAFQFPLETEARMILGSSVYQTRGFVSGIYPEISTIIGFENREYGAITISVRKPGLPEGHFPFLPEEHDLLNEVGKRLGRFIDKQNIVNNLIKAKEKAEISDRLKTSFLQNISHEIRTPLNGIIGFSDLIAQPDATTEEQEMYHSMIKLSGERLITTLTDFMDASLLMTHTIQVSIKPVNLGSILQPLVTRFRQKTVMQNLELVTRFPVSPGDIDLMTDAELLGKVFSHILNNALKFTKTGLIGWDFSIREEQIEFRITDSGIGIDPAALPTLFEPFSQEETGTSRSYEGSGLGLMITKGILEILGGEIGIASEKEHGTCVTITLPFNHGDNQFPHRRNNHPSKANAGQPVVLIVEDDITNRIYMEYLLQKRNFKVLLASNGKQAVTMCKERPEISLVLMDLKMPVLDGYSATRLIREFRPLLPIIAVTAFGITGDERKAMEAGCTDYLNKPFLEADLLKKLQGFV